MYVTEGIGFNLFSRHDARARQTITLGKDGAHLFDGRLTFPRDLTGSSLFATRIDPTPTTRLTAVPALSGAPPPPPSLRMLCLVSNPPPSSQPSPPPLL